MAELPDGGAAKWRSCQMAELPNGGAAKWWSCQMAELPDGGAAKWRSCQMAVLPQSARPCYLPGGAAGRAAELRSPGVRSDGVCGHRCCAGTHYLGWQILVLDGINRQIVSTYEPKRMLTNSPPRNRCRSLDRVQHVLGFRADFPLVPLSVGAGVDFPPNFPFCNVGVEGRRT
eukprot:1184646-Prorocentrum_minimum.AAC.5